MSIYPCPQCGKRTLLVYEKEGLTNCYNCGFAEYEKEERT